MKKLFTLFFVLSLYTTRLAAQCPPSGLTITTQADLDFYKANYPNCESIDGDLYVISSAVSNLNGLEKIKQIKGALTISGNDSLLDISGFSGLKIIGGYVRIQSNVNLLSLNGLHNLEKISGEFFYLDGSPLVTDLKGLSKLDTINGIFQIWEMNGLTDLDGLQNLSYIANTFALFRNSNLLFFRGLSGLNTIGETFRIYENPSLTSIIDISKKLKIFQSLVITDNPELAMCSSTAICEYLVDPPSFVAISKNAIGCSSEDQVKLGCEMNSIAVSKVNEFIVYPNPGNGIIEIAKQLQNVDKIEVINQVGQIIDIKSFYPLDLTALPPGIYNIRASANGHIYLTKYFKQ